ncbi:hypothetical protein ACFYVL_40120 [Streptomyces sp. NPDC004111]|uniref:hypothetical protein n=1 Tax=Streptomyces sp. NPDC004111 TaxID=3364690 RepID=UPI0036BD4FCE
MTRTTEEGPDERPYEEVFGAGEETLTVTLKDGAEACFGTDGAVTVRAPMAVGLVCVAEFKPVGGRLHLTRQEVTSAAGETDIKPDAVAFTLKQLRADAREAFDVAWDKRGAAFAERRIRALPRQGVSRDEEQIFQAAIVYNLALLFGKDPTKTVMERFGCSKATAKRWVGRARDDLKLIKKPDELKNRGFPEDEIPWLEADDPQFMANFVKVMDEMAMIMPPRMYHLVRGAMFIEMLSQVMDGEGSGGEGADEEMRSVAQQLLYAITGTTTLADEDNDATPAAPSSSAQSAT